VSRHLFEIRTTPQQWEHPVGRVEMFGLRHLIHVGHLQRGPNDQ
jgi:hypothetical protein